MVLITSAPSAYVVTQGPALLKSASVYPLGLRAPTEVTGTAFLLGRTVGVVLPAQGPNAAGNISRAVASLPAEQTTATPQRPSFSRMRYIVLSNCLSFGVSW